MNLRDATAALMIAIIWGVGFVAMKVGVRDVPPLAFSALRFLLAAFPAVFFVAPPKTRISIVVAYGVAIGVLQFGFVFTAIKLGMPAGMTSLLMQSQVFFTVLFAWIAMGEKPTGAQLTGGVFALLGVAVIGAARAQAAPLLPFFMVIAAAGSWALGNVIGKLAGRVDMFGFTVWSSLAAPAPLLLLSSLVEGQQAVATLLHPGWASFACAAFLAWLATLCGYSMWADLLSRYRAPAVAPFSLLVPVFGFLSAQIAFDEPTGGIEMAGAAMVFAGLAWILFGAGALSRLRGPPV